MTRWGADDRVAFVRTALSEYGITNGASLLDVAPAADGVLVTFRWRQDPTSYAVLVDDLEEPRQGSAEDLRLMFMEELDTGAVRSALRRVSAGHVLLDFSRRQDHEPPGCWVSSVPVDDAPRRGDVAVVVQAADVLPTWDSQGDAAVAALVPERRDPGPGGWLAAQGYSVTTARQRLAQRRLVCWLQVMRDDLRVVGHAVASWSSDHEVVLDQLETAPGLPTSSRVAVALAWQVAYEATEQGARRLLVVDAPDVLWRAFGLTPYGTAAILHLPADPELDPRFSAVAPGGTVGEEE